MCKLLEKEIKSKEFIDLYWKAVKAHYVNPVTKEEEYSIIGTSEGGSLSPILCNVYLHELDKFMEEKCRKSKLPSKMVGEGHRIYYVRYADDILVGVNGDLALAEKLREEIKEFLKKELQVELDIEKTKITSAITSRARYLGATVRALTSRTNDSKVQKRTSSAKIQNPQGNIRAFAPIEEITKKLQDLGMCKIVNFQRREVIPNRKTS